MRHAGTNALDSLEPLLQELRAVPGLVERSRGIFYRKSKSFLHFHEDPAGLFADVREVNGADFRRIDVNETSGRQVLVKLAKSAASG